MVEVEPADYENDFIENLRDQEDVKHFELYDMIPYSPIVVLEWMI